MAAKEAFLFFSAFPQVACLSLPSPTPSCASDAALKFHPDKLAAALKDEPTEAAKAARKEEIETHFKSVQLAYEVLFDPVKRRVFDSTDEFDDEVPGDCAPEAFFSVYGPAFQRNGKWAANVPAGGVPELGKDDAPMSEVDAFYDYWFTFKSWREFPNEDEYELESAESREHKRWMERQNMKLRERARKEEAGRIRQLVENAYKRDPRVARRRDEEKREKARKKEEKARERVAKEEEEKRREEEERQRREEEDKRAAEEAAAQKKIREKEKKLVRKERARLRAAAGDCVVSTASMAGRRKGSGQGQQQGGEEAPVTEEQLEDLCQALDLEKLRAACEQVEALGGSGEKGRCLRVWMKAVRRNKWDGNLPGVKEGEGEQEEEGEEEEEQAAAKMGNGMMNGHAGAAGGEEGKPKEEVKKPWGREEIDLLKKLVSKFPKGTGQRWEVIAEQLGTGRTADEVVRASKTVMLARPDDRAAFDSFLHVSEGLGGWADEVGGNMVCRVGGRR